MLFVWLVSLETTPYRFRLRWISWHWRPYHLLRSLPLALNSGKLKNRLFIPYIGGYNFLDIANKVKVNLLCSSTGFLIEETGGRLPAVLYYMNMSVR
jgi:hypothetical protein